MLTLSTSDSGRNLIAAICCCGMIRKGWPVPVVGIFHQYGTIPKYR
jgi:hypothetical protein